ncbi:MAG TPA: M15 family metallopeptidase [Caulobacteraceae bacterium]|nr:M15 family metallopeptidase [Caulobacteraceae bacterium]
MPLDPRSQASLAAVHPDLVKVVTRAHAASPQPFEVIQGLRTLADEKANVAKGASQTLHSRHLPNADGLACAVDVAAVDQGHISWNPLLYQPIAQAMKAAAAALQIPLEWGGDWKTLKDWGHFQLPWAAYP